MDAADVVREAYSAYYRRLVAQVYGLTGDFAEAQDVVQEGFARVLARPRGFLAADDQPAYLRVVALNIARGRFRRRVLFERLVRTGRVAATPAAVPGLTPDRLALVEALRRLPFATREVVVLHHIAELSVAEVARTLGVPEGTVKARLSRGRATLAQYLTEAEEVRHA
jgi:RNA polymerase sigma factor (sigma-70 family)